MLVILSTSGDQAECLAKDLVVNGLINEVGCHDN